VSDESKILEWVYRAGFVVFILDSLFWFAAFRTAPTIFMHSDAAYRNVVLIGLFASLVSLFCGLIGKGKLQIVLVIGAVLETGLWWFMGIGG